MLKNYIKLAIKVLLRRKMLTFINLFGIVFTLVVLIIVTTMIDNQFGAIPPETKQGRTLYVWEVSLRWKNSGWSNGSPGYEFLTETVDIESLPHIEHASVFSRLDMVVTYTENQSHTLNLKRTDGNFWKIMEFAFLEGEPVSDEDERDGNFVAVISETTRKKLFGNKSAIGRTIDLDGRGYRVIGVVEDVPVYRINPYADVWVPISTSKSGSYRHDGLQGRFTGAVLVSDKSYMPVVKNEYNIRLSRVPIPAKYEKLYSGLETNMEREARQIFARTQDFESDYSIPLISVIVLLMAVFMLLPSINLVSINISRIFERSTEIGIRKAFGASSRELIVQFVFENIVLTMIGGIISFIVSYALLHIIHAYDIIPQFSFALNMRVLFYGICITLFFGIMSGLYPAWKMSRYHPVEALQQKTV